PPPCCANAKPLNRQRPKTWSTPECHVITFTSDRRLPAPLSSTSCNLESFRFSSYRFLSHPAGAARRNTFACTTARSGQGRAGVARRSKPLPASTVVRSTPLDGRLRWGGGHPAGGL